MKFDIADIKLFSAPNTKSVHIKTVLLLLLSVHYFWFLINQPIFLGSLQIRLGCQKVSLWSCEI